MNEFFTRLREIYDDFDMEYMTDNAAECGTCELCCTKKFAYPPLSLLDLDYLDYFIKEHNISPGIEIFKRFIENKDRDYCPYWNKGCTVYKGRPFFCRTYGMFHFDSEQPLHPSCIYQDKTIEVTAETRYKKIKHLPEYLEMRYKYEVVNAKNNEEKVKALVTLGGEYINQFRFEEGLLTFLEAEKLAPEDINVLYDLGFVYRSMNKFSEAKEKLEKCIALGGEDKYPYLYQHTGFVYLSLNLFDEALKAFTKATELEPEVALSYLGLALYYFTCGNKEKAMELCRKGLEIEPDHKMGQDLLKSINEA
ncbi:MAG: tetratricopeptide repeat protein [Candidatus Eremiobacterota bacterium]